MSDELARPQRTWLIVGRVLTGLAAAFLLVDAGVKLSTPEMAAANSPEIVRPVRKTRR